MLSFKTTWMNMEHLILSEISKPHKKTRSPFIAHIYNSETQRQRIYNRYQCFGHGWYGG
jgi:hypothetical protein